MYLKIKKSGLKRDPDLHVYLHVSPEGSAKENVAGDIWVHHKTPARQDQRFEVKREVLGEDGEFETVTSEEARLGDETHDYDYKYLGRLDRSAAVVISRSKIRRKLDVDGNLEQQGRDVLKGIHEDLAEVNRVAKKIEPEEVKVSIQNVGDPA